MTVARQSAASNSPAQQGGLARSLVRTLLIFTFIPLILMAGAAYLRTRALLREQVINETQSQMSTQLNQMEQAVKAKAIRLDRLIRTPDFASQIEAALSLDPRSEQFSAVRNNFNDQIRALATFNQFMLMMPDGTVRLASKPEWESLPLKNDNPSFHTFSTGNNESYLIYNVAGLYPNQLVLATVMGYRDSSGVRVATIVGFTETPSLEANLQALINLYPSANAYFITQSIDSKTFVKINPNTGELVAFQPSESQDTSLSAALDNLMNTENHGPQAIEFNEESDQPVLAQVAWSDPMKAGIVFEVHKDFIFGQLNSLIPFTIALFLAALFAMGLVLWLGANRVFQPLASLTEITRRFSEGDFSQRAEARSNDEIGLLAQSFNQMAEELGNLYRSLEQRVEERTRQIRTAAEVAQQITSTTNLDELLNRTVQLIVEQFNFYQASIFMLDRGGKLALLHASYGPAAKELLGRAYRLEVGSASIIGWVTANNQPRLASDVAEDPIHLRNELLPETRAEVGIPIAVGNLVLGALDVQSTQAGAFGPETVVMLQTIASQIAVAIQNVGLVESTQVNFQELERLHRASRQIAASHSRVEIMQTAARLLADSPYPATVLSVNGGLLEVAGPNDVNQPEALRTDSAVQKLASRLNDVQRFLSGNPVIVEAKSLNLPAPLTQFSREMSYQSTAFLPIMNSAELAGLIVIGGQKQALTSALVQPYANMADLIGTTLDKLSETEEKEKRLSEREALVSINRAVAQSSTELGKFFAELHSQIRQNIGDYAFVVALYDKATQAISIPYMYEEGRVDKIEAFPLGEGLSSILIRTGQPLLLVENVEQRATELGAKVVGKPARSWMGVPMIVQNEPIGALIIQDLEREHAFTAENLNFFAALSNQVAAVIYNVRLLEESRARALQLETAAEIARDISTSLNLDELLAKAVNYIRERFDFYHASIFLIDLPGEFAVIREATGEAGTQMKRAGHKLGVGSKSIVGYVAGRGELLIVNDTTKDATYLSNPLLPNTRSEAALPLKVGERVVGVMDVQSIHPYIFTGDNLRTLQILADQMAVAVVNSELFAESQEHLSQHRLLHHITATAASGATLDEALESAVTGLQVTLGGDRVTIMLADREKKLLEVKAAVGYSEDVMNLRVPIGTGITGWVAEHRRPLRVDDVTEDPRYIQGSVNTKSELAIPLTYRNEILGVLNVESEQTGAYTESDEEMLGTLSGSLAAVIANARLVEQIRGQAERERALYEITSKIRRSTDMQTILATTASELTRIVGARRAQIKIATEGKNGGDDIELKESGQ